MDTSNPLQPLPTLWLAKIELAKKLKAARFGRDAEEGMKFYTGPYGFLYKKSNGESSFWFKGDSNSTQIGPPIPQFQMTLNKVAELVQIFGPTLYHQNPNRQVNPRRQVTLSTDILPLVGNAFPQMQMVLQQLQQASLQIGAQDAVRAILLQDYLNATPNLLDLKTQARMAVDEALIKGMGLLMPRVYEPPNAGHKVVGSFFVSVDDLVIDPDATSIWTAKWIGIRRIRPKWEVCKEKGLDPEKIKGTTESLGMQATVMSSGVDGQEARAVGKTSDVLVYWEIYSKCGLGKNLCGNAGMTGSGGDTDQMTQLSDSLAGDYAYLEVSNEVPYPLNCPPELLNAAPTQQSIQEITKRFEWPIPFWADGLWPVAPIIFHSIPNDPWPMSHIAPAMGELKFLNWCYSHLAGKVLVTSRDFIAIDKGCAADFQEAIRNGGDLSVIQIETAMGKKDIRELVQFLQHPAMQGDIFKVCELVEHLFEQRTGLIELKYGLSSRQYRSAAEAEIKEKQADVRPEEMQNEVEDAMSMLGRMEAFAARWSLQSSDVVSVLGMPASYLWQQFVQMSDPRSVLFDLVYRIEAGSVRKPNRSRDAENWTAAMQNLLPFYQSLAAQGMVGPFNALIKQWAKSKDLDAAGLMLPVPPPPQPPPGGPPQGIPQQGPPQQRAA